MSAVFIVSITTVNAQVDRISVDTVSSIKKVVRVETFKGIEHQRHCIPLLHVDGEIFKGSKAKLLSFIPNNTAPRIANDSYIAIRQGTSTSIYEKQKEGSWEQLTVTIETISDVRIVGKELFATFKNLQVKEQKLAQITNENMLKTVPKITHWDFISHW